MLLSRLRFAPEALAIGGQLSLRDTRRFSVLLTAERLLERSDLSPSRLDEESFPAETSGLGPGVFDDTLGFRTPITPRS